MTTAPTDAELAEMSIEERNRILDALAAARNNEPAYDEYLHVEDGDPDAWKTGQDRYEAHLFRDDR